MCTHTHTRTIACYFNSDMLMHYHPGALRRSKWSCCRQVGHATLGCLPTYHLLTRSSSRYAQIRRKDTLTNCSTEVVLPGSQILNNGLSVDMADNTGRRNSDGVVGKVRSAPGLSNSCLQLASDPPHSKELFNPTSPLSTNSQTSSRTSTDPSVDVENVPFTHVSIMTSVDIATDVGQDGTEKDQKRERHIGRFMHGAQKSSVGSIGQLSGQSQVAPAWTSENSSSSVPCDAAASPTCFEYEHRALARTLPRSFKTRPMRRSEGGNKLDPPMESTGQHSGMASEEDLAVVSFPRMKRGSGSFAIHYTPNNVITPITEHSSHARPVPSIPSTSAAARPQMKHSKTFIMHRRQLPPSSSRFCQSMRALTKPLIEPKVSLSNPNVVHV